MVDNKSWIESLEGRIKELEHKVEWLQRIATLAVAAWALVSAGGLYVFNWLFGGRK